MRYKYPIVCDRQIFDFFELLEGFRSHPYRDKYTFWTIGIGHNLTQNPLPNYIKAMFWPPKDEDDKLPNNEEAFELMKKNGITIHQARYILNDDIVNDDLKLHRNFPNYEKITDEIRQIALLYMCFNLGFIGLKGFRKFCAAFSRKKYENAADEIVNSNWYKQIPRAAKCIEHMIRSNEIPPVD